MGNDFTVVPAAECAHLEKPVAVQECQMGECQSSWFTTEWSAVSREATGRVWNLKPRCLLNLIITAPFATFYFQCSRSCGRGLQVREVRCLTPDRKHSQACDASSKPEQEQACNTIPCGPQVTGGWIRGLCVLVVLPSDVDFLPSRCVQIKTAGTDGITAWWWCRPECACTPTTKPPAAPPAHRALSGPRDNEQQWTQARMSSECLMTPERRSL